MILLAFYKNQFLTLLPVRIQKPCLKNKAKQYLIENKYIEECMPLSNQQVLDKIEEIVIEPLPLRQPKLS